MQSGVYCFLYFRTGKSMLSTCWLLHMSFRCFQRFQNVAEKDKANVNQSKIIFCLLSSANLALFASLSAFLVAFLVAFCTSTSSTSDDECISSVGGSSVIDGGLSSGAIGDRLISGATGVSGLSFGRSFGRMTSLVLSVIAEVFVWNPLEHTK